MNKIVVLKSQDSNSIVKIENGELVNYIINNEEVIHQKGMPGWRNSDTEMFPLIGPTAANNFIVSTPKGNCIQDQHGLLRELDYSIENQTEQKTVFYKNYIANTKVKNSKFPEKSSEEFLSWPYSFSFKKGYELSNTSLKITFEINAEKGMPFMLGYHPAFKLDGNKTEIIRSNKEDLSIQQIMDAGSVALSVLNTSEITMLKEKGLNLSIKTKGFNNFMLWTEVPNMLCIEPITAYPYTDGEILTSKLFNISKGTDFFNVEIVNN